MTANARPSQDGLWLCEPHRPRAAGAAAPGYEALDLLAHVGVGERTTLRLGLGNLTDEAYRQWSDIRGRPAGDPVIDRYSRPGRAFSASINFQF